MTHTEELIARLRDTASRGVSSWGDLQQEAADQIVGQDLLIEVLKKQLSAAQETAKTDAILLQNLAEQLSAQRLATELAVAAEREACAKLCDDNADIEQWQDEKSGGIRKNLHAKLIRARGQA